MKKLEQLKTLTLLNIKQLEAQIEIVENEFKASEVAFLNEPTEKNHQVAMSLMFELKELKSKLELAKKCLEACENKGYISIHENFYITVSYEEVKASNGEKNYVPSGFACVRFNSITINLDKKELSPISGDRIAYGEWYDIEEEFELLEWYEEILKEFKK